MGLDFISSNLSLFGNKNPLYRLSCADTAQSGKTISHSILDRAFKSLARANEMHNAAFGVFGQTFGVLSGAEELSLYKNKEHRKAEFPSASATDTFLKANLHFSNGLR